MRIVIGSLWLFYLREISRFGISVWINFMDHWYVYAILSLILMGTQRFLYKVSAERHCNTAWTSLSFMGTVAILSLCTWVFQKTAITNIWFLLWIAALNSGTFLIGTVSHMEALKHLTAATVYSLIRLNVILVVLFSIFFFKDRLSIYQFIGIICAIAVIILFAREPGKDSTAPGSIKRGFLLVLVSLLSGAGASVTSKFAAIHVDIIAFMAVSYSIATLGSLGLKKKLQTDGGTRKQREALIIGLVMGGVNFFGYYLFLKALSLGPLSIIISLSGMHFVIAIVLSAIIYKEKMTQARTIGVALTMVSVILLRL